MMYKILLRMNFYYYCYIFKTCCRRIRPQWKRICKEVSWRHYGTSVKINFKNYLKVIPKYIRLFKSVVNCENHILRLKHTRWHHFGLAAFLKHQLSISKISTIISKHFKTVFIYLNRLENAKTRWRQIGLAAILKRQTSETSY
jgi:hypothetical protein